MLYFTSIKVLHYQIRMSLNRVSHLYFLLESLCPKSMFYMGGRLTRVYPRTDIEINGCTAEYSQRKSFTCSLINKRKFSAYLLLLMKGNGMGENVGEKNIRRCSSWTHFGFLHLVDKASEVATSLCLIIFLVETEVQNSPPSPPPTFFRSLAV